MSSDTPAIETRNLSKVYHIYNSPTDRLKQAVVPRVLKLTGRAPRTYYHEFRALHDLSLNIQKGETLGIIGRNGSGKSTLLQLICGTLTPTSGEVKTQGRITALLELGSGFNPEFTGRENVFLNGAILGLEQSEIQSRFDAIADFADIGEFIEQPVKFYSSGMTVRLAFAVQAMVDPDILIVDEALAVGDERFQRKCFRRLEELKKLGTSILFVSHDGHQIVNLCDRALFLEKGQSVLLGQPLAVVRGYHRFLYASPESQPDVLDELKQRDGQPKADAVKTAPKTLPKSDKTGVEKETDFYEAGFLSQSAEILPEMGARIESIEIYNAQGQRVNHLLMGQDYFISVKSLFLKDCVNVDCRCYLQNREGITITGIRFPKASGPIQQIYAGQRYELIFPIKMLLRPDIYFIGAGVWSSQEVTPLHQVLDFTVFRVVSQKNNSIFGYFDISTGMPEFKLIDTKE